MNKRKIKFNVVDLCIIVLVGLLLLAFAHYANSSVSGDFSEGEITYTVSIEGFNQEFCDLLRVGDKVRNIERACDAGVIVAVTPAQPDIEYTENLEEGTLVSAEVPGKYRCTVSIKSPYKVKDTGYFIDEVEIKTGKKIALRTPTYAFNGIVMDIERSDD